MANPYQDCVVLLGDSLTQSQEVPRGLFERMNKVYARKLDVLNRGFNGYNTNGINVLLDQIFAKKGAASHVSRVRLVTIWLGNNDSTVPSYEAAVPLPELKANLDHILSALTSSDSPYAIADTPVSIILITPGPMLPSMFALEPEMKRDECYDLESTRKYKDAVLDIGREWKEKEALQGPDKAGWKIETLDLWESLVKAAGGEGEPLKPYFTDGVHHTSKGYDVLWTEIIKVIRTKFKGRGLDWEDPDDLPSRVPPYELVDWKRPESVIEGMKLPKFR